MADPVAAYVQRRLEERQRQQQLERGSVDRRAMLERLRGEPDRQWAYVRQRQPPELVAPPRPPQGRSRQDLRREHQQVQEEAIRQVLAGQIGVLPPRPGC